MMLSLLLLAPPLGVVVGYLMSSLMIAHLTWKWSFYIQSLVSAVPTAFVLLAIKGRYLDIESAVEKKQYNGNITAKNDRGALKS